MEKKPQEPSHQKTHRNILLLPLGGPRLEKENGGNGDRRDLHHGAIYPNGPSGSGPCRFFHEGDDEIIGVEGGGCTTFTLKAGGNDPILTSAYFSEMGWFKHQLDSGVFQVIKRE